MATAAHLQRELQDAGVPTHLPAIQQLIARKAFESVNYDLKAIVRDLPAREQVELAYVIAHQLSWSYGSGLIGKGADIVSEELREEDAENARRGSGLA